MPLPYQNDPKKPDYRRREVVDAAEDLTLIRDLLGGPRQMWQKAETYIKRWTAEDIKNYQIRASCEPLTELFARTLSASVGKLFAKPPKVEYPAREAELAAEWDNIDAKGTKGTVALKLFANDGLADGLGFILVDHTAPPVGVTVTAANEGDLGLRPQWKFYPRTALMSWRTAIINNVETLVQVVFAEAAEEADGEFGATSVQFFRELRVVNGVASWRLWRAPATAGGEYTIDSEGEFLNRTRQTRGTIPLSVAYTGRKHGTMLADPPLRPVAYANVAHWQVATDLAFGSKVAGIEQFVVNGQLQPNADGSAGTIKLGWLNAIQVEAEGDAKWVGPSGSGLDQLAKRKVEKEQEIAALGLSFLSRDTRAAETAEAKRMDAAAEDSTLATVAQAIEDAANQAWVDHCWYKGIPKEQAPTITLNRDYSDIGLTPQMLVALAAMVREGMPPRLALEMMQQRGLIAADADLDRLADDWMAGQSAADDAAAVARETMNGAV